MGTHFINALNAIFAQKEYKFLMGYEIDSERRYMVLSKKVQLKFVGHLYQKLYPQSHLLWTFPRTRDVSTFFDSFCIFWK